MANEFEGSPAHSAEFFGETRDHWYTPDFLPLVASRWRLAEVSAVLDVGSGAGHWGRALGKVLPSHATVTGVDPEPLWVEKAAQGAARAGYGDRFTFREGRVEALPFADCSFDLVTCQTVLIHCQDPAAALREMIRVTRPGGRVAVAEPNNVAYPLLDPAALRLPIDDVLALVRLQLHCERGKTALGEGNVSLGELVPGLFVELGLEDVSVFQNDRTLTLLPPYRDPAQRAYVEELESGAAREHWMWSRAETERYYLAGGGDPVAFGGLWALAGARHLAMVEEIREGRYCSAGGSVMYMVCGRRGV
ncbi:MAG: methyltransferase domain-containing protein, partial [Pseudomonadota bacterium]|nr:methyltransferase domain-containing protein [Pseudomonadota bacterium]